MQPERVGEPRRLRPVLAPGGLSGDAKSHVPMLAWPTGYAAGQTLAPDDIRARLEPARGPVFWEGDLTAAAAAAEKTAVQDLAHMTLGIIVVAGFLDGLNPCAFATAVFLVGYLLYLGRGKRDIALLGGSFCLGVFLSYFLIGLGMSQLLRWLTTWSWVKTVLYAAMGAFGLVLGILHARDAVRFRATHTTQAMAMGLSLETTRKIHEIVRRYTGSRFLVPAGLLLGLLISSLELACTGQIYLPTLVLINRSGVTSRSLAGLLLYNVAFILPLLLVTVLAATGVSAKVLAEKARQNVVGTKIAMAILFFLLGGLMLGLAIHDWIA